MRPKANPRVQTIKKVLAQFQQGQFDAALRACDHALSVDLDHPDLHALKGISLCYLWREEEALSCLALGRRSEFGARLGQILVDHFHCRQLLAVRLDQPDPQAFACLEEALELSQTGPTPGVGIDVCLTMIVRDEEENLPKCLESASGFVDRIAIIDTGSKDGTLDVAKAFGAKIGHFEWNADFSAARNASLRLAEGAWALWLDADERLTRESWSELFEAIVRPHFAGFALPILNFYRSEGDQEHAYHAPIRLFRLLPETRFEGKIHEQVASSLAFLGLPFRTLDGVRILHEGYRPEAIQAKGKTARTLELLENEVREQPTNAFQWFNFSNALAAAGRYPESEHAARTAIRNAKRSKEPFVATAWQILALALIEQGKYGEALVSLDQADHQGVRNVVTLYQRADVLARIGRWEEAHKSIEASIAAEWTSDLQGDHSIATFKRNLLRGQILNQLGRADEALLDIEFVLKVCPNLPQATFARGDAFVRLGRYRDATIEFEKLLADPDLARPAWLEIGHCRILTEDARGAAEAFERAWRLDPSSSQTWIAWVKAAEATGDAELLVKAYSAFAEENEPDAEVLINWGRALQDAGETERALDCFTEALKRDSTNSNAYFNCGDLLYRLQRYPDAAHLYESGLRYDPVNPDGWFVMGNALAQMGLIDGARIAYRQCLSIQPDHGLARSNSDFLNEAFPQAS